MILLVLACLILIMGGGFTYVALAHPPGSPGDWAAWTQAAFSVVAIVASVGLVEWQAYREKRLAEAEAKSERHRYLDTTFQLVGGTAQVLRKIASAKSDLSDVNPMREELSALTEGLAAMDLSRLSGHTVIESLLVTVGAARTTLATIDEQKRRLREGPNPDASPALRQASNFFLRSQQLGAAFAAISSAAGTAADTVEQRAKNIAKALENFEP